MIDIIIKSILSWLSKVLQWDTMPPKDFTDLPYLPAVEPETAPTATSTPKVENATETVRWDTPAPVEAHTKATLENLCAAIRDFEGVSFNLKTGRPDQNYRLNNPGNCRYNPDGYLPMYGKVGKSKNGFAIFETWDIGWWYLKNMIRGQIHKRPNQTLLQFMQRYAPLEDENNPIIYATFIANRLSTTTSFRMGDIVL